MAKASKTFVDWLREGERGWEEPDGFRWKLGKDGMWLSVFRHGMQCPWERSMCRTVDMIVSCEVFPRPAPRRVKAKTAKAFGLVASDGTLISVRMNRPTVKCAGDYIVPGTFTYTPKARKRK